MPLSKTSDVFEQRLHVRGTLPTWLTGTLARQSAWPTGDVSGHLHLFALRGGSVTYQSRPVPAAAASAWARFMEDPASRLFRPLLAHFSHVPGASARRIGQMLAGAAEPLAAEPDAALLAAHALTRDERTAPLPGTLFVRARLGAGGGYRLYRARARGVELMAQLAAAPQSYVRSVGQTPRHLVLALAPLLHDAQRSQTARLIDQYVWSTGQPTQFAAFDRETGALTGTWEADPCFLFHHVHTFERAGELFVDVVAYPEASIIEHGQGGQGPLPGGTLRRYRLRAGGRRALVETLSDVCIELPRTIGGRAGAEPHVVFAVGLRHPGSSTAYDQLVRIDLLSGRDRIWTSAGCQPGEPVLVRRPGARSDADGVVLSVVWDASEGSAFLLALDAASFSEIARAHLPLPASGTWVDYVGHPPYALIG